MLTGKALAIETKRRGAIVSGRVFADADSAWRTSRRYGDAERFRARLAAGFGAGVTVSSFATVDVALRREPAPRLRVSTTVAVESIGVVFAGFRLLCSAFAADATACLRYAV